MRGSERAQHMATAATDPNAPQVAAPGAAMQYILAKNTKPAGGARPGNVTHTVSVDPTQDEHTLGDESAAALEPATDDKPATTTADSWTDPETGDDIPGKPSRYQRRLSKLWEKGESERQMREAAEKRATDAEARLAARDAAPRQPSTVETAEDDKALTMAAQARIRPKPMRPAVGTPYKDYEDYVEDVSVWGGELAVEKRAILAERQQAAHSAQTKTAEFDNALAAAKADYPDFDEVMDRPGPANQQMWDATINGPKELIGHIMYYLGSHPDERARIAALPPGPALVAMGEVIATVRAERADKKPATPQKTKPQSDAPDPPSPIRAASTRDTPLHKVDDPGKAGVNPMDWMKSRNEQVGARRRI